MNETRRGPRRFSAPQLATVGVTIIGRNPPLLECDDCFTVWSPNLRTGGRLPRGYWMCPMECNSPGALAWLNAEHARQRVRGAYHEGGHVVVGFLTGERIKKATIDAPYGLMGTVTFACSESSQQNPGQDENVPNLKADAMIDWAGVLAESLFMGEEMELLQGTPDWEELFDVASELTFMLDRPVPIYDNTLRFMEAFRVRADALLRSLLGCGVQHSCRAVVGGYA